MIHRVPRRNPRRGTRFVRFRQDKLLFEMLKKTCHCEERSDVAIPRIFREVRKTGVLSTLAV